MPHCPRFEALQPDPSVVLAHARMRKVLANLGWHRHPQARISGEITWFAPAIIVRSALAASR
jgi:hypothetical protein